MALDETQARERAEAEVRAFCGWHVAPTKREVLVLDGEGTRTVFLPTLRLTELHSLSVNGTPVDLATVQWSPTGIVRYGYAPTSGWDGYQFTRGQLGGVEADVTHGWETWPLEVLSVVDRLAARTVADPGNLVQVGQVRVGVGQDGLPLGGTLTDVDRDVLLRYRIPGRL